MGQLALWSIMAQGSEDNKRKGFTLPRMANK
jgi:hypothetical protein